MIEFFAVIVIVAVIALYLASARSGQIDTQEGRDE